jgi:hypothetical protein
MFVGNNYLYQMTIRCEDQPGRLYVFFAKSDEQLCNEQDDELIAILG